MFKRILVFLLLNIALVWAVVFVTCKYQPSDEKSAFHGENETQSAQPTPAQNANTQEQKDKSGKKPPWWYEFVAWPGGIENWAIILTLEFIGWQAFETYLSAKAATRGIEIQEAGQRAWLSIRSAMKDYEPTARDHQLRFWWVVENRGHLTGQILETQCQYELVEGDPLESLSQSPNYPEPIRLDGHLIAVNEANEFYTMLRTVDGRVLTPPIGIEQLSGIQEGTVSLRVYGYVKYIDGLKNERESRFIEYYVFPRKGIERGGGFRKLIGASPEYTKCT